MNKTWRAEWRRLYREYGRKACMETERALSTDLSTGEEVKTFGILPIQIIELPYESARRIDSRITGLVAKQYVLTNVPVVQEAFIDKMKVVKVTSVAEDIYMVLLKDNKP